MVKNPPVTQESQVLSWVGNCPWRRDWIPTPIFLPGEPHGQRSLVGCVPWGHRESDTAERLSAWAQLIDNAGIVSGEEQNDSATHVRVSVSLNPLPSRLPHHIKQSSWCCTVGPSKYSSAYTSIPNSLTVPSPSFPTNNC